MLARAQTVVAMTLSALVVTGCGGQSASGGLAGSAEAGPWNGRIYQAATAQPVDRAVFLADLGAAGLVVIGEKHYTAAVQSAEAAIIAGAALAGGHQDHMIFAWEFLSRRDQAQIDGWAAELRQRIIMPEEFLRRTQGNDASAVYAPVITAARDLNATILATNLTRAEKAPVTQGGLAAADPRLIPPGFAMGDELYRERFAAAMSDHVPADKLENYYAAQCLTDDVMGYALARHAGRFRTMIVGSFHAEFGGGLVARIRAREPDVALRNVRIIDAADHTADELLSQLRDERYGAVADYVYFVNEPAG